MKIENSYVCPVHLGLSKRCTGLPKGVTKVRGNKKCKVKYTARYNSKNNGKQKRFHIWSFEKQYEAKQARFYFIITDDLSSFRTPYKVVNSDKFITEIEAYYNKIKYIIMLDTDVFNHLIDNGYSGFSVNNAGYSICYKDYHQYLLHRVIYESKSAVDHINGNKLDNRLLNLRNCTIQENCRNAKISKNNTSGFTGVCFDSSRKKWKSYIVVNGRQKLIGRFDSIIYAKQARSYNEMLLFGQFSSLKRRLCL